MEITIQRPAITDSVRTISTLSINNEVFSDVMEDRDRGLYSTDSLDHIQKVKIKHETAIPYGRYQVVMSFSNRFQKYLPEVLNVPGFSGIRIHPGNTEADSSGCLLPGVKSNGKVIKSRETTSKLIASITQAMKKEKVFLNILPSK